MISILWPINIKTWAAHIRAIHMDRHHHRQMRHWDSNRMHMTTMATVIRRIMMMIPVFTQTIQVKISAAAAIIRIHNQWITTKIQTIISITISKVISINRTKRFNHHKMLPTKWVAFFQKNGHVLVATHITKWQTVQTTRHFSNQIQCQSIRTIITSNNTIAIKSTQLHRAQWIVYSTMAHLYSAFIRKHIHCPPK